MPSRICPYAVLAVTLACAHVAETGGGPPPAETGNQFPSKAELKDFEGRVPAEAAFAGATAALQSWELAGPFPDSPVPAAKALEGPFAAVLGDALARNAELTATRSLACVARELGRVYLLKGAHAPDGLQRFVRGRCQDVQNTLALNVLTISRAGTAGDEELAKHFHDQLVDLILKGGTGPREVGLWFGHGVLDNAVVYVAEAPRAVKVLSSASEGGKVALELELLQPADRVEGLFNRGAVGVGRCDLKLALPRVRVACAPDAKDRSTWIDVTPYPPGHLLSAPAFDMLVWPGGAAENRWDAPAAAKSRSLRGADARADFLDAVNQRRTQAGLPALTLAADESEGLERIAPMYFAGILGRIPEGYAELVALGAIAGWDVDGAVKQGFFSSGLLRGADEAEAILADLAAHPSARVTLFDPAVTRLAVAPLPSSAQAAVAILVASYAVFGDAPAEEDAVRVWTALAKLRADAGQSSRSPSPRLTGLAAVAANRVRDGADPQEALRGLLKGSSEALRRSVRGWVVETSSLSDLKVPPELTASAESPLAVGVTWRKKPGQAWGRYVILIVADAPKQLVDRGRSDHKPLG